MAAVPVGYEAFRSLRRRGVTLLCFLLASAMAMGITVYVDSYSVHEWDKNLDVGDVALRVGGDLVQTYVDEIRGISGVTKASAIRYGYGQLSRQANETAGISEIYAGGRLLTPSEDFLLAFPDYIQVTRGRMPQNETEITASDSLNIYYGVNLGDVLLLDHGDVSTNVTVVGFYKSAGETDYPYYYYFYDLGIVLESVVAGRDANYEVLADVDRSVLSAFNPSGSLAHMSDIDNAIIALDPNYDPVYRPYSDLYVQDYLATGISQYIAWVQGTRITEMLRASSVLLLVILVIFLAIRYNVNERRYEENILVSRGASKGDLEKIVTREVLELSIVSTFVGILLGILFSRIAISATSYFAFSIQLLLTEPLLVSLDSLIIAAIVGLALPMLTLGGYRAVYSTKRKVDEDVGRIAKLARGFNLIRWDIFIVAIAALLLLALSTGGSSVTNNLLLSLILPLVPLPLFLGFASLSIKALRRSSSWISRRMKRVVGQIPSSIGIRRVGKEASSAGAAAMVLVLAICLSWNCAIVDASLPVTANNQAKLAVGADLTFTLDRSGYSYWDSFVTNVTNNPLTQAATLVSQKNLYLSAEYGGSSEFMGVNPNEYINIGYDYLGNQLNNSDLSDLINQLESTPDGAILTSDIADAYELSVGDILRASTMEENAFPVTFRILGITESLPDMPRQYDYWYYDYFYPPPLVPYYYYFGQEVGSWRVMVNRVYLGTLFNLVNDTDNFLCVKTFDNANTTKIVEDLTNIGGLAAIESDGWDSVYSRTHQYLDGATFRMERSIDTMLTVLTVGSIVGAFSIYAVEGIQARRREIALLRAEGASKSTILKAQAAEMLILVLFSLFLLLVYAPLFLSTSVASAGGSTSSMFEIYPINVFPVIPLYAIIFVLGFFLVTVSAFIVVIAALSSKINLAEALNSAWAEVGPHGGDV